MDIRLTDFDVVLARGDVELGASGSRNFATNSVFEFGGASLEVLRGWAWVDATVRGRAFRFVNTHLEPADFAAPARQDDCPPRSVNALLHQIQLVQAGELLKWVESSPRPMILAGDLNSAADGCTTDTCGRVREADFVDAWQASGARDRGFTASQDLDLLNRVSKLFYRIDFVFYRGAAEALGGLVAVNARLVGAQPGDRTPSGLWPSDHAGVSVTLRAPPGRGIAGM